MNTLRERVRPTLGYRILRFARHWAARTEQRHAAWLELRRPAGLFQPFATTRADRYPETFEFVRSTLGDGSDRRILSFGCSSGEEVFSLRRYFPEAVIRGLDINPRNIGLCHDRLDAAPDPSISFARAGSAEAEPEGHYDAAFAMAVFRHGALGNSPPRCTPYCNFAEFERQIRLLAARLRPGGLLVVQHANFRFTDTRTAIGFAHVFTGDPSRASPLYGKDDRLLPLGSRDDGVYRKVASST